MVYLSGGDGINLREVGQKSLVRSNIKLPLYDKENPVHSGIASLAEKATPESAGCTSSRISDLYLKICKEA